MRLNDQVRVMPETERYLSAYERTGMRPAVGVWFMRDENNRPCGCPLAALLVDCKVVDENGNNLIGYKIEDCRNFLEVASCTLEVEVGVIGMFLSGYDGDRAPQRPGGVFTEGRNAYGAVDAWSRRQNDTIWRAKPIVAKQERGRFGGGRR